MNPEVVIVGAGAAGITAARRLAQAGHRALILEARGRAGGRAWTDTAAFGFPIDMGSAWLHSAEHNPWTAYAKAHGFDVIEQSADWGRRIGREEPSAEYRAGWFEAMRRTDALIVESAAGGVDVAISQLFADDQYRPRFDAIMTWLMGADSDRVSSLDYARYGDSETDWAVASGLGAVI
ncbi:MAG TPA: FAD-dependent oxidoreductase, partial [Povalibacter sp.]|nr:FAD-dependent oxidoreductase [Povalibacter sp.]